jgi:tripartite-type tricarboxylate transporter receptor subunit TctC
MAFVDGMSVRWMPARIILGFAAGTMALAFAPGGAAAQELPPGEVRLIAAFPAGSGSDVVVRWFAEKLKHLMNRTVIVENKPGAGGNIATEYVSRAKPDGSTIYFHTGSSMSANMHVFKKPPVDVVKAMQVVGTVNRQAFMLVVHPDKPWKNVAELTAYLKTKGDKASYAVSATSGVVMCALYKQAADLKSVEVNFRMAQDSLNDIASGAVDYACHDPQFASAQVSQNRLRVLGIASAQRLESNASFPTMKEQGVDMDLNGWFAAFVPAATPRPMVDQLNKWLNQILVTDEAKKFLAQFASDVMMSTPDEGQARLVRDIQAWGDYVRIAKIEPQG